jgi:hypothetical protein
MGFGGGSGILSAPSEIANFTPSSQRPQKLFSLGVGLGLLINFNAVRVTPSQLFFVPVVFRLG